jgi:hypothetical protein
MLYFVLFHIPIIYFAGSDLPASSLETANQSAMPWFRKSKSHRSKSGISLGSNYIGKKLFFVREVKWLHPHLIQEFYKVRKYYVL